MFDLLHACAIYPIFYNHARLILTYIYCVRISSDYPHTHYPILWLTLAAVTLTAIAEDPRGLMPVLWHQSLLTFVQRYKHDLTHDDREALKPVLRMQEHGDITKEIRRELYVIPNQEQQQLASGMMMQQ